MKLIELFKEFESYTVLSRSDRIEIWKCLNRMENSKEFGDIRKSRMKIEDLIGFKFEE